MKSNDVTQSRPLPRSTPSSCSPQHAAARKAQAERAGQPSRRSSGRRAWAGGLLALSLTLGACGPRTYMPHFSTRGSHEAAQSALEDLRTTRTERTELDLRAKKLDAELQKLKSELDAREAKLGELTTSQADLQRKYDDLVIVDAELSQRLKSAGQSVEQLAKERGAMNQELAQMRSKLDELNRQQGAADARASQLRELLKAFRRLVDAGKLKVGTRRGRMVLELPNDVLFDSGKTDLKEAGLTAVTEVAAILKTMSNRMFQVAGHTDDVNIQSARFPSNWELSVLRAVEVTKKLVDAGMDPRFLSAAGYGEWDPAADNASPEGRAKNRRIEITLVPNMEEFIRAPEAANASATK